MKFTIVSMYNLLIFHILTKILFSIKIITVFLKFKQRQVDQVLVCLPFFLKKIKNWIIKTKEVYIFNYLLVRIHHKCIIAKPKILLKENLKFIYSWMNMSYLHWIPDPWSQLVALWSVGSLMTNETYLREVFLVASYTK